MANIYPIEVPIEEARRRVAPRKLEDVLEELKKMGTISYFVVRLKTLCIWQAPAEQSRFHIRQGIQ